MTRGMYNAGLGIGLALMFAGAWIVQGLGVALLGAGFLFWFSTLAGAYLAAREKGGG